MRRSGRMFLGAAVILSQAMCAHVAWAWCALVYGARYEGTSAPAHVALLWAIPYLAGIALCALLAYEKRRRFERQALTGGKNR